MLYLLDSLGFYTEWVLFKWSIEAFSGILHQEVTYRVRLWSLGVKMWSLGVRMYPPGHNVALRGQNMTLPRVTVSSPESGNFEKSTRRFLRCLVWHYMPPQPLYYG